MPEPRVASAGDEADRRGMEVKVQAGVQAAWSRFEERSVKSWSRPAQAGGEQ